MLLRETSAARLAAQIPQAIRSQECVNRVSKATADWLQCIANPRPETDSHLEAADLLGSNLHSAAMWACFCAVQEDWFVEAHSPPHPALQRLAWILVNQLEASLEE